jgi:hypothetical protein
VLVTDHSVARVATMIAGVFSLAALALGASLAFF